MRTFPLEPHEIRVPPKNKLRTTSLFYEFFRHSVAVSDPVFTLGQRDLVLPDGTYFYSLHRLFVEKVTEDPTEYSFAMDIFGEWVAWDILRNTERFKRFYDDMRQEVDVKVKSQSLRHIAGIAADPENKQHYQANKLLLDRGWQETETAAEKKDKLRKKREAEISKEVDQEVADDLTRLGFNKTEQRIN